MMAETSWSNHEEPLREWKSALGNARMPHGWIFSGVRGLGKRAFAEKAARMLVGAPQGESANMALHPDIIVLSHLPKNDKEEKKRAEGKPFETKRNISVAQIREMQKRLVTRPTLGERRAIIIDPADDLERSASNALLKSLEEPPQGTFFILLSHSPAMLLPTILSRCRMLRFARVSDREMAAMLDQSSPEMRGEARRDAIDYARGSPGKLRLFLEENLAQIAPTMRAIARDGDPHLALRGKLAQLVGTRPDRARLGAIIDLARVTILHDIAGAGAEGQRLASHIHQELVDLGAQLPTYNFDSGLAVMQIGGLLAGAAEASEPANG